MVLGCPGSVSLGLVSLYANKPLSIVSPQDLPALSKDVVGTS